MLNFERLRALHAVAAYGSVNAAATALHVTNSAVSQQIAKLENELGQSLLEPNGRGVRLTDAAAMLVAHTQQILSLMESAEAEVDAQRDTVFGRITVAAFPTAARGLAPHALQRLHDVCPQLRVVLTEQDPPDAVALLVRGDLDLVIAQDWENAPLPALDGLSKSPLMDDIADIALPASHPLARREMLDLDDLRRIDGSLGVKTDPSSAARTSRRVGAVTGSCTHFDRAVMNPWLLTPLKNTPHNSRSLRLDLACV